jgi:ATP-dependent DNA helicase DinG
VFKKEGRMPAAATESFKEWPVALKTLSEKLAQLNGMLEKQAERCEGLENCSGGRFGAATVQWW